jgi:O-antigen ligase
VTALRGVHARSDEVAVAGLTVGGLVAAALAGAAAAGGRGSVLAALGWLALVGVGLRSPAIPFVVALLPYTLVSTYAGDNTLLGGAEKIHAVFQGPLTYADMLTVAAGVAAVAALVRMPAERRARIWTPLSAPVLALLVAGMLSGLVIHREGSDAVFALVPLARLTAFFMIACVLFAGGHLSRIHLVVGAIVAAQLIGVIGILNSLGGGSEGTVITETTLPGGQAPVDERTVAFVDAAGPFVMAFALVALLTRVLWSRRVKRWMLVALAALPFIALVLSARRAMWLDFAIASVIVVGVSARVDRRAFVVAVVALSIAGVAFVTLTQASPAYRERLSGITTVFSSNSSESNIRSRQIETAAVWKNIRRHPLEGIGLATPYLSNVQFQYQEPTYLHNNALWIWLKFGLVGLLALIWLVWRVGASALQTARELGPSLAFSDAEASLAASATMLGFFVAMLTASFLTASVRPPVIAGVLMAIAGSAIAEWRLASGPKVSHGLRLKGGAAE